jgi:hypothetical protein
MNRKMSKLLDTQLIEAHLKLDPDQLANRKLYALFQKVFRSSGKFTNTRDELSQTRGLRNILADWQRLLDIFSSWRPRHTPYQE